MLFPEIGHFALVIAWITFFAFWFVLAFRVHRAVKRESIRSRASYVLPPLIAYFLLFSGLFRLGVLEERFVPKTPLWTVAGIVITYAGIGLAIWARMILGKNWSSSVTIKQDHSLILTGPYAFVRHPIYSGILLALLGSAVIVGRIRILIFVPILLIGFLIKSRKEERFMTEKFGRQYEEYRQHTKALIPFLL